VRGEWNVSIRRVCRVLLFDTSSYHYKSRRPGQAVLEQRIEEICQTQVRYGYRRVHVLLCREGWRINHKKTYRVYREMGLQLRNKTPKRRVKAKLRDDRKIATRASETWAMNFVHDQLATGRKIRVLTVVDTFSRYATVIDPRLSYRGEDVVQVLEKVCARVGYPTTIRVDQGTEFVSRDLDLWAYTRGVTLGRQCRVPSSALPSCAGCGPDEDPRSARPPAAIRRRPRCRPAEHPWPTSSPGPSSGSPWWWDLLQWSSRPPLVGNRRA
jgi:putative transposase